MFKNKKKISFLLLISFIITSFAIILPSISYASNELDDNDNWNQHKGNEKNTGHLLVKGPEDPTVLWKYTFDDDDTVENSSPVIDSQGNVYIGTVKGYLYSIDKEGNFNWKYNVGSKIETTPAISSDAIYVSNKDKLYAINHDGTLKWSKSINTNPSKYPSSTTISNDGTIYVATISYSNYGSLYAFNPDGTMKWNSQTYQDYGQGGYASTPAIDDDGLIYYYGSEKELYCMDPSNGGNRWKVKIFGSYTVSGSPAIGTNGNIIVMEDWGRIYSYTKSGRFSWQYVTSELLTHDSLTVGVDGSIFANDNNSTIYSLNVDGTVKWTYKVPGPTWPKPIHWWYVDTIVDSENTQYVGTTTGRILALKSNGTEKWWFDIGEEIRSTSAMDNKGILYFPTYEGSLYAIADKSMLNQSPIITISRPIANQYFGIQDKIYIEGTVKDENTGDKITIRYSIKNTSTINQNINLIQPKEVVISNSQEQSFQGDITLENLSSGSFTLEIWAEDNKKAKSTIVEMPIMVFSTLENILNSLKSYVHTGKPQIIVINSDTTIIQTQENNKLIEEIKKELEAKNILIYFIGKDGQTESYIRSKLFSN